MTTPDPVAAAKRLLRCRENGSYITYADAFEVAEAIIAEHPDDSEMPIDAAWLEACGFKSRKNAPTACYSDWLTMRPLRGGAWAAWILSVDSEQVPCLAVLMNRSDLRRLAAALGINLKETP